MAWQKGQSGNPLGKAKVKRVQRALDMVLCERGPDDLALRQIMAKVVDMAVEGERWACEYVRDTLDGKPSQQVNLDVTDDRSEDTHGLAAQILALQAQVTIDKRETHKGTSKVN